MRYSFETPRLPEGFFWLNEPRHDFVDGRLRLVTGPRTDFWQRTHYGFSRDDGHALLTDVTGDFTFTTQTHFSPRSQYDQCGVLARLDRDNWVKASIEYEDPSLSRLGSVVTNLGYSDWATQDAPTGCTSLYYRMSRRAQDLLVECSHDGLDWRQMRIAHLHALKDRLSVGLYACSPTGQDFACAFSFLELGPCVWRA